MHEVESAPGVTNVALRRQGPRRAGLLDQRDDLLDDLVEGVRRGVDVVRVVGHRQRRGGPARVDRVAADQVGWVAATSAPDCSAVRRAARAAGSAVR